MESKEYIYILLEELHKEFPSFTFRYQYDDLDESHVIEYSPFDLTEGDLDFENKKYSLLISYFDKGFDESLVFINEFDPVGIEKPELIYEGSFCFSPKNELPEVIESSSVYVNPEKETYSGEDNYSLAA